jgi:hypothetical protein
LTQGTEYQISELMIMHNNTTATQTEYAVLESGEIGTGGPTYTTSIASGNLTLQVTISDAASTNVTALIKRTLFAV